MKTLINFSTVLKSGGEQRLTAHRSRFSMLGMAANVLRMMLLTLFVCPMAVFGQLKVQPNGDVLIGGSLSRTVNHVPIVFRVNNIVTGSTGSLSNLNVSFGYSALSHQSLSTGARNNAFGLYALQNNTTGQDNNAFGYFALRSNDTGWGNNAFGNGALGANFGGNTNNAFGRDALGFNTSGSGNCAFGYFALYFNTTGSHNTAVGDFAGSSNTSNLTNATAIGYAASNTQSNEVRIGNNTMTRIGGQLSWSSWSDGRAKRNIRADVPGLNFINLLQPVTYSLDLDAVDEIQRPDDPAIRSFIDSISLARSPEETKIMADARANQESRVYTGFIAQDVEKAAQSIGFIFSGVDAPENDKSPYGLRYAEFVAPLVKAVQELSEQNDRLQAQINALTARLDELTNAPKSDVVGIASESEQPQNFSFSLFPNPTNGFVTVDYTMFIDAQINIGLYNMFGQMVKLIVPQQNQKAGTYSVQISVGDLAVCTYIINVSSGNQIEAKQLVINQ